MIDLGLLLGISTLVAWSFSDVIVKKSLSGGGTLKVLFWSQLFGSMVIAATGWAMNDIGSMNLETLAWMIGFGLLNLLGMGLYYLSLQHKEVALSTTIVKSWVLLTVLLGIVFYGEIPLANEWLALGFVLCGLVLITHQKGSRVHMDKGFLAAFASMLVWGVFFFLLKDASARLGEVWMSLGIKGFTAVLLLPYLLWKGGNWFKMSRGMWAAVFVIGTLDGIGMLAYTYATKFGSLTQAAAAVATAPALVAILGYLILKEHLKLKQMLGIGSAMTGLVLLALV